MMYLFLGLIVKIGTDSTYVANVRWWP